MAIEIRDGAGSGYRAAVDKRNKLTVISTSHTEAHTISFTDGQAYIANTTDTADTLTLTATGGPIVYIKNTSTSRSLIIESMCFGSSASGVVVVVTRNPTLGTIGNENTHAPVNCNYFSGNAAEAIVYTWDEVGDGMTGLSGGTKHASFILPAGTTPIPTEGSLVIGRGDSIMFSAVGAAEFTANIHFYYDTAEFE